MSEEYEKIPVEQAEVGDYVKDFEGRYTLIINIINRKFYLFEGLYDFIISDFITHVYRKKETSFEWITNDMCGHDHINQMTYNKLLNEKYGSPEKLRASAVVLSDEEWNRLAELINQLGVNDERILINKVIQQLLKNCRPKGTK